MANKTIQIGKTYKTTNNYGTFRITEKFGNEHFLGRFTNSSLTHELGIDYLFNKDGKFLGEKGGGCWVVYDLDLTEPETLEFKCLYDNSAKGGQTDTQWYKTTRAHPHASKDAFCIVRVNGDERRLKVMRMEELRKLI
jgi:hypothetical protein